MSNIEQTLSIIKPDAVERNLQDQIKIDFESKGFEILKEKKIHISKDEAEKFYESEEYQKMIPLRTPYSDLTHTIFEGV